MEKRVLHAMMIWIYYLYSNWPCKKLGWIPLPYAAFERSKLNVITGERKRETMEILNDQKGIDIVLMDIIMPEMYGLSWRDTSRYDKRNKLYYR